MSNKRMVRVRGIDSLRGIFALSVLAFHFLYRYDSFISARSDNPFTSADSVVNLDFLGLLPVFFFFIISGFVIRLTVEKVPTALDFAFARFSRLYPAYWASVFLTSIIVLASSLDQLARDPFEILVNLTMIQSAFDVESVDGVYWSLYVELWFYLFVFLLRFFNLWRFLPKIIVCWTILAVAYGFLDQRVNPVPTIFANLFILKYAHFFIAGMVFYQIATQGGVRKFDLVILTLCLIAAFLRYPPGIALSVVGAFVVFGLVVTERAEFLSARPLLFLGTISYSLYLVHQNIGYVVIEYLDLGFWLEIAIATGVAIVLASGITYVVERPAQKYLRRLFKR